MSNGTDLIDPNSMSEEELRRLTGGGGGNQGPVNTLPRLEICREYVYENAEGEEFQLPAGSFQITLPNDEGDPETIYCAKKAKATFRPYINAYQNMLFDPEAENRSGSKGAFVNKTVIIRDWSEEMIDERGGTRCGKVRAKDRDGLTKEQLAAQRNIQAFRYIYGTVTFSKAHNATGEERKVESVPCFLRLRGTNFMPFDEEFLDEVNKQKKLMFNFEVTLSTTKHKNGDTTYWVIHYAWDRDQHLPLSPQDFELLMKFDETIRFENAEVTKKYDAALKKHGSRQEDVDDERLLGAGSLEDDFNDDPVIEGEVA